MFQILEAFGGIGSPRKALKNLGIDFKSIDYIEIDPKAVSSYNEIFRKDIKYNIQDIRGYTLKPDIFIHGSPCQNFSIAGKQEGADENSGTSSSLMWETINIIKQMGVWKPKVIIWENVKNALSKHMFHNFSKYLHELELLGYKNSYKVLNAMDYGLPQNRDRVFVISFLNGPVFNFDLLEKKPMNNINNYLEDNSTIDNKYIVNQPSILSAIGKTGIKRATIIEDYSYTITTRQDRCPAQVIDMGDGRYRFLTERECWRLQGFSDEDFNSALKANPTIPGKKNATLYKQAGNSIPVVFFETIFKQVLSILKYKDFLETKRGDFNGIKC